MKQTFTVVGAGGASVPSVLLAEQPESKRERATGAAGHDAAGERARPPRAGNRTLSPPQVPPSSPSSSPPSPPPSSSTAHPTRPGRGAATRRGRRRRASDARRRSSGRQRDAWRRRAQDDRSDLQRRPEDRHVHARQGDHLRERGGPRSGGRVSATAAVATLAVATLRGHESWTATTGVRDAQVWLGRHRLAPPSLSSAAVATRGRPSAERAPRCERHRAKLRGGHHHHHRLGSVRVGRR